ncbi:MAG: undecaprenyl-phosphate galactose phosphotransferase WbaP [Rickettsiales bacterium]
MSKATNLAQTDLIEQTEDNTPHIVLLENIASDIKSAQAFGDTLKFAGRCLLISDMLALTISFILGGLLAWMANTYLLHDTFQPLISFDTSKQFFIFAGLGAASLLWLDTRGHYRQRLPYWEAVGHIVTIAVIGFLMCGFIEFAAKSDFSRLWLGLSWVLFAGLILILRRVVRTVLMSLGRWSVPAILIGDGHSATAAIKALKREPQMGFTIVRQISAKNLQQMTQPNAWKKLLHKFQACHIFLALDGSELEIHQGALKALVRERVPCSIIPPWMDLPSSTLSPHHFMMHDVMMLHDTNRLYLPLPRMLKRGFDIMVAGTALLLLSPLFILLTVLIRRDGGPAFFTQARTGRDGEQFRCFKFRSMRIDAEAFLVKYLAENPKAADEWQQFQKLKNDVRITRLGHFIRKTSIDELPQLINVVKGDMSLVGPRPIMPGQENYYEDDFVYYESVRPGITGPWQVSGRNALTFKERVALEVCYARNWSLWMDIVIILKTIPALLKKENAF